MRGILLNEGEETRKKIAEEERLALLWKRIKKIGFGLLIAVEIFFTILGFSDPGIASLFASSFIGNNKQLKGEKIVENEIMYLNGDFFNLVTI